MEATPPRPRHHFSSNPSWGHCPGPCHLQAPLRCPTPSVLPDPTPHPNPLPMRTWQWQRHHETHGRSENTPSYSKCQAMLGAPACYPRFKHSIQAPLQLHSLLVGGGPLGVGGRVLLCLCFLKIYLFGLQLPGLDQAEPWTLELHWFSHLSNRSPGP